MLTGIESRTPMAFEVADDEHASRLVRLLAALGYNPRRRVEDTPEARAWAIGEVSERYRLTGAARDLLLGVELSDGLKRLAQREVETKLGGLDPASLVLEIRWEPSPADRRFLDALDAQQSEWGGMFTDRTNRRRTALRLAKLGIIEQVLMSAVAPNGTATEGWGWRRA